VPFKYIKWIAHNPISDQSVKDYYLQNKDPENETVICKHCEQSKTKEEMVPGTECFNLPGVFHKSNVCQDCYDKRLALHSVESICKNLGISYDEKEIPEDFINAKIQITRMKRKINQKTK
jgi:hypothetical protein